MRQLAWFAVVFFGFLDVAGARAATIGLGQYLEQVRGENKSVRASRLASQGAESYRYESTLLLAPTLFGNWQYLDDRRNQPAPAFQGDRTEQSTYTLGVSKLTSFGLEGKLSYNLVYGKVYDIVPGLVASPAAWDARPVLELTQSLWKNAFGASTRASQRLREAQAEGLQHAESFRVRQTLADGEAAYWRLALARELVVVSRESVDRAVRIRDWAARRERLQLGDKSDRLQAEAALELRKLDLQTALDDLRSASRAFNSIRQIDSDDVPDALDSPDAAVLAATQAPARAPFREDVLAARAQERATEANAELSLQTLSPDIQLYGSGAFDGRDPSSGTAISNSFKSDRPTWLVGLRFTAPLDIPEIMKSREGHRLERAGAAESLERKVFEQESDWKELSERLGESKRRLSLNQAIESVQREKLLHEKDRLSKGRTTTYQVLMFEQDYATAQLARIRAENDVVRVVAQMKTYGSDEK